MPALNALWHAAATCAAPALRVSLRMRARAGKEIAERLPERLGIETTSRPAGTLLWLHAASVGETVSLLPVIAALPDRLTVLLTTGTVTSQRLFAQRLPTLGARATVLHRFVPLDVPRWVGRFLDHWRPDAAAFVESELWPNTIAAARTRDIPLALINARLSVRSARHWAMAPGFARAVLGAFRFVLARSEEDAVRLRGLGAKAVEAPGDLKRAAPDLPVDDAALAALRHAIAGRPVWLAASTHPGEEAIAASVHRRLAPMHTGLLTIIVPRHPERGPAIATALGGAPRRAAGEGFGERDCVWIADTLGELGLFYRLARIVFMGKSLQGGGGQNPLEPARLGAAICVGPHTENFAGAVADLREAGGLEVVADEAALAAFVAALLADPARVSAMGEAAGRVANATASLPGIVAGRLAAMAGC